MGQDSLVTTLQDLIKDSQAERFEAGMQILEEGSSSTKMYVILQGQVRVYKNYKKTRIPLAMLGPGEIVGELALFDTTPRSASVVAVSSVVALSVNTVGLRDKIAPSWILPVLKVVVERLRVANQTLANLQNLNEFSKKAFKRDPSATHLVSEALRFCKTLRTFIKSHGFDSAPLLPQEQVLGVAEEVVATLQSDLIGSKAFIRAAKISGILNEEEKLEIALFDDLLDFLEKQAAKENQRLPSHSCLRLIEKIISEPADESVRFIRVSTKMSAFAGMPLFSEAILDFGKISFVIHDEKVDEYQVDRSELESFWVHMRFLKSFDYTDVSL